MTTWDEFSDRLALTLRSVSERVIIIVGAEDKAKFVQFAGDSSSIRAEAAPVRSPDPTADESVLTGAGWIAPDPSEMCWTFILPMPAYASEYKALADRCVIALRDALHVNSPDELHYRSWRDAEWETPEMIANGGSSESHTRDLGDANITFPTLQLPRVPA